MSALAPGLGASDNPKTDRVVSLPGTEERARRLAAEVERLASLSPTEWRFYLEQGEIAKKYGIETAALKEMIEATIREAEKKRHDEQVERQQIESRAEKQRAAAEKEAKKKERERQDALAAIVKLPSGEHEARLRQLARRLGEDLDGLRVELALLLADEEDAIGYEADEPWPEPVATEGLLDATLAQLRRYVVIHDEHFAVACALWALFAWCHEIASYSPLLVVQAADADSAKTTLSKVLELLTPRALMITEPTGPVLYRTVDRDHPTLIIDDADQLLPRKPDLASIINASWTRGTTIPRLERSVTRYFDPFCPKVLNGINLLPHLRPATRSRCITGNLLPKLPDEKVIDYARAAEDEDFLTLRRKAMRWAADSMAAVKSASPALPEGFSQNRQRNNYTLLFAIADLAGGSWPKRIRAAAVKLSREHNEPSLGKCLLAKFYEFFIAHGLLLTSKQVETLLAAEDESEWSNYRDRGRPINRYEVAHLLKPFGIRPDVIHPRGKPADRGYNAAWFEVAFRHYLGKFLP